MDESSFNQLADATLTAIEAALAEFDGDLDYEIKPGGVIEIECDDGSKVIVNRHTAAREIWIAARSGGFHFRHDGKAWVDTRAGTPLKESLERCLSQQTGNDVRLQGAF